MYPKRQHGTLDDAQTKNIGVNDGVYTKVVGVKLIKTAIEK